MSYFRSIYLEERVIHIEDPAGVFATLFVGEKEALLFDTGYGFSNLSRFVKTLTNFPLTVVCSHCHFDHVLGSADFQELYLHEADIPYYEYYTSKDWGMAQSYHLCLNSSRFGVERCVGMILSAADGCGAE